MAALVHGSPVTVENLIAGANTSHGAPQRRDSLGKGSRKEEHGAHGTFATLTSHLRLRLRDHSGQESNLLATVLGAVTRKDRGLFSVCGSSYQAIVLCESAIDALSCHLFHPTYRCVSTSGARPDPAWLSILLSLGSPVFCGFDSDPTGDLMAQRMIQLHPSILRLSPPAKDWNDFLRSNRS